MPRTASPRPPLYVPAERDDGREHVVFESIVALLALLLVISGFCLYVSQAFARDTPADANPLHAASAPAELPLSLAER